MRKKMKCAAEINRKMPSKWGKSHKINIVEMPSNLYNGVTKTKTECKARSAPKSTIFIAFVKRG